MRTPEPTRAPKRYRHEKICVALDKRCHGRDAPNTSFATIFGNAVMRNMNISTQLADENAPAPQYSEQAISNYPSGKEAFQKPGRQLDH